MESPERAILAGVELRRKPQAPGAEAEGAFTAEESLKELRALAESAGAVVEETVLQARQTPDAATLIGAGKVEELRDLARFHDAGLIVFDSELTPTQLRNIEKALGVRVVDRTQLILDIFARRARTREGQLQVELAQLNYLLPRLAGRGVEMSRLGGGIGTRGPGETQLETDRRKIARRVKKLEDDLDSVRAGRTTQRRQRQAAPLETAALVGYTNAGKSTLFNRLTGAGVTADARLFATLDTTVRQIVLPSKRKVLLSDTVGFIRNLPTTLVKAFRATLEETVEASLLLHVVDASSPNGGRNIAHVNQVIGEIGAGATPRLLALNKWDLAPEGEAGLEPYAGAAVCRVSARTGDGVEELIAAMDRAMTLDPVAPAHFRIPVGDGAALNQVHERARIVSKRLEGEFVEVEAEAPRSLRKSLERYLVGA